MVSGKQARRARKRERAALGHKDVFMEARAEYIRSRIVCDRCGQDQPFKEADYGMDIAPCEGSLGIPCRGLYAHFLDYYEIPDIV